MRRELVNTKDNSHTLYVPALQQHYHSIHGAIQESQHVFIEAALHYGRKNKSTLSILEVGLGTGLNALLTALLCGPGFPSIQYTALEKYPLSPAEAQMLNYPEHLSEERAADIFSLIHQAAWEQFQEVRGFQLLKRKMAFEDFRSEAAFDIIYYDAFAPNAQPELWSSEIFSNMYEALKPDGILTTYCAKGSVRRAMSAVGFRVEKIPGPPGKREMVRAHKS